MRFAILLLFLLLSGISCSKKAGDGGSQTPPPVTDPVVHHYIPHFTRYHSPFADPARLGLQMSFDDSAHQQQLLLFGNYAADKTPNNFYFSQLVRQNNDTIFNYQLNDTLGLSYLYFTVKNQATPLPGLVKFSTTPAGLQYVGFFSRNWAIKKDSLIREFYYDGAENLVYSGRKAAASNRTEITLRGIYWVLGLRDGALDNMVLYTPLAAKIAAAILFSAVTGGGAELLLLARLAGTALTAWGVWKLVKNTFDNFIPSASAAEIPYGTTYPSDLTQSTGSEALSGYQDITETFSGLPPILLYEPQLSPDDLTMNIVCRFVCSISNYRSGSFYLEALGGLQQTDSASFFFTRPNGERFATLHKQKLINVGISSSNVVTGQVFIANVWPLEKNWTMDSVHLFFREVKLYAGASVVGGGWGPVSNVLSLQNP